MYGMNLVYIHRYITEIIYYLRMRIRRGWVMSLDVESAYKLVNE